MVDQHIATGAGVTVSAIRQPISLADQFGVIEVDAANPTKIRLSAKAHGRSRFARYPHEVLASMGTMSSMPTCSSTP